MPIATTEGIAGQRTVRRSRSGSRCGVAASAATSWRGPTPSATVTRWTSSATCSPRRARGLGADAIVGARFDAAAVGHDMGEIVAYGTAVIIERLP